MSFRVHGFGEREFLGTIARVNPAANATTRQVEVLVTFDNAKDAPNVAGLYAEGRVETRRTVALDDSAQRAGARGRQCLCVAPEGSHAGESEP